VLVEALSHEGAVPSLSELRPSAVGDEARRGIREAALHYVERAGQRPDPGRGSAILAEPSPRRPAGEPDVPGLPGRSLTQAPGERGGPRPLAQFRESYIVAQDEEGLVLVDQHAAHERILFERYLREADAHEVETQQLLFPVTIELPPHERVLIEEEAGEFERLGFRLEPFGGDAVRIDAVPAVAASLEPTALVRELLGEAARSRSAAGDVGALRHRLVTTAACRAAIKVHHTLTTAAMQRLLDDLWATGNPTTCPHGRPVVFRLTLEEIERAFRRR
jgi:DNA mismatch repair protein MutL